MSFAAENRHPIWGIVVKQDMITVNDNFNFQVKEKDSRSTLAADKQDYAAWCVLSFTVL